MHLCEKPLHRLRTIHRNTSDEELLAAFRQTGKNEQFQALYERYIPLIYGVFAKYTKDLVQAREMVVQLFELLPEEIRQTEIASFRQWLYGRVRLFCRHHLPDTDLRQTIVPEEKLPDFGGNLVLESLLDGNVKKKDILACIEGLPEKQRITVYRFFVENRSCGEIEESTGFSRRMVWNYLRSGKRTLRDCLRKKGVIPADK